MDKKIKVTLLMEDGLVRNSIRDILSMTEDIILTGETDNIETCLDIINNYNPDVIVVGEKVSDSDGFKLSSYIMQKNPFQSIVLIAARLNADTYKNALYAGIREVLREPVSPDNLKDAISRVYDLKNKKTEVNPENNTASPLEKDYDLEFNDINKAKIISTFSIKGGVGKTTVATNLAISLAQDNSKVALLDMDLYSGDVALALNVIPRRRMADLANDINRLDMDLLESYMVRHSSGVMVFTAPFKMEHADYIKPKHIEKIIYILKQEYDYIIIDCPSYFYDIAMLALGNSSIVLLLVTMDILSLKSIKNSIAVLESLNFDKTKLNLVLNQYIKGVGLTVNDIETTIAMPLISVIPMDNQSVISSMNQGIPLVIGQKRSKAAKAINNLAKEISKKVGDAK